MKKIFCILNILISIALSNLCFAECLANDDDYFKVLASIQKPPTEATVISPSNLQEKHVFVRLLKQVDATLTDELSAQLKARNYWTKGGDEIELYKGNFSNERIMEYMLIATGGTIHANSVIGTWKIINNHLVPVNYNAAVINSFFPSKDMSRFYMNHAEPFAIVKNGTTYLRYMEYPAQHCYDKSKLKLCTYIWQNAKVSLVGPQDCIGGVNYKK